MSGVRSEAPASSRRPGPPLPDLSPARGEGLFSDSARRLAGIAGAALGWRPDEFWNATPAELAAVIEALSGGGCQTATSDDVERLKRMFPDG